MLHQGGVLFIGLLLMLSLTNIQASPEGKPLDLSAHKGKVVYADFWASWCAPCRQSFPWLNEMAVKYPKNLVVLGVNVDTNEADATQFLKEYPAGFPVVYDPEGTHANFYQLPGMPTAIVFDRKGNKVHQHIGFKNSKRAEYEASIKEALAQ